MADPLRRVAAAALAALLAVGVAACGDDGGDTPDGEGSEQPPGGSDEPSDDPADEGSPEDEELEAREAVELPATDQPFADALANQMSDDFYTREQASCIATRVVAIVGSERLAASGLTPEEFGDEALVQHDLGLDRSDAEAVYEALTGCGEDYRERLIDAMVEHVDDPDPVRACLEDVFTPEVVRDLMLDRIEAAPVGGAGIGEELTAEAEACADDLGG